MNNFRKHRSAVFTMIFIIVFTILLDFYANLLKFREQVSISDSVLRTIETNDLELNIYSQGVFAKTEKVLVAATSKELTSPLIFVSSRNSKQIKVFRWKNQTIIHSSDYELSDDFVESKLLSSYAASEYFIFDLIIINGRLYVSTVFTRAGDKECDELKIVSIDIDLKKKLLKNEKNFWKYPGCIKWRDGTEPSGNLSLRLETNNKALFMAVGLEPVNPQSNVYPGDALLDLPSSFYLLKKEYPIFGSILRIPLLKNEPPRFDIVATGLRSPQGLIIQPNSDGAEVLFISDHGPRGGDELNRLDVRKRTEDFGWPNVSLGTYYLNSEENLAAVLPVKFGTHEGYRAPVFSWTPSIAPSQLLKIPDAFSDISNQWRKQDLLLATLKDESIHKLTIDDQGFLLRDERIFIGERIRDMDWLPGSIILGTDSGKIVFISPKELKERAGFFPPFANYSQIQEVTIISYLKTRISFFVEIFQSIVST